MSEDKAEIVLGVLNLKHEINEISVIRSANHFGINRVFVIGDPLRKNEKSCTSCHRKMKVRRFEEIWEFLTSISAKRYELVLMEKTENSVDITDFKFPKRCVIMSGHESKGFPKELLDSASHVVHISTHGNQVKCLNTAVACGIGLYEATKHG